MASIGNIFWFIFGGCALALGWLALALIFYLTIIGIPIGRACVEFAKLSAFPFGKEIVRETDIASHHVSPIRRFFQTVLNIIWLPIGVCLTIVYIVYGILSCITIVGIPVGIVYMRMGKFLLLPIGARVVER
jgi:uncharacterized membrane protein YccF (DUF307 family)